MFSDFPIFPLHQEFFKVSGKEDLFYGFVEPSTYFVLRDAHIQRLSITFGEFVEFLKSCQHLLCFKRHKYALGIGIRPGICFNGWQITCFSRLALFLLESATPFFIDYRAYEKSKVWGLDSTLIPHPLYF